MKISTKGRYALRLMIDIASHDRDSCMSLKEISERQGISLKYLEQIISMLCKAGFLMSIRGSKGGYTLAKSPDSYTIGEILRVVEGDLSPVACLENGAECSRSSICPTLAFWQGLRKAINDYVDSYTLEDLVKQNVNAHHSLDFSI